MTLAEYAEQQRAKDPLMSAVIDIITRDWEEEQREFEEFLDKTITWQKRAKPKPVDPWAGTDVEIEVEYIREIWEIGRSER